MKPRDPYFDRSAVASLIREVESLAVRIGRPVRIMEVCGTHTHAIGAAGLRRLLPDGVRLISGPGCPVCVTPVDYLDHAEALAELPDVTICTFGDLMRVPSSRGNLEQASARGGDIRIVYSPQDALNVASDNPDRRIVFLGVGFETTLPTIAAAVEEAESRGVGNFLVLPGAKLIEPALRALSGDDDVRVDAFLLPGHVSVIVGADFYKFVTEEFGLPAAIVGFTPVDVVSGIAELLRQIVEGTPIVANLYKRVVQPEGNTIARSLLERYFEPVDTRWRGLGVIPKSGLAFRSQFVNRDASRIEVNLPPPREPEGCRCGEVLKGTIIPPECALFDTTCTPQTPVGACMVSGEGTCAAWYRYERLAVEGTR